MSEVARAKGRLHSLFRASAEGDLYEILDYVHDGLDVNAVACYDDDEPVTALILALRNGHRDCVDRLISCGADVNCFDHLYTRAALYASREKKFECLRSLAVAGFYKNLEIDVYEELMSAAQRLDFERLDLLLSENSNQMSGAKCKEDELSFRIMVGYPVCSLETLINRGVDVNGYNSHGFTPLISAVLVGSVEWIDCLLQKGADITRTERLAPVIGSKCTWVIDELSCEEDLSYPNSLISDGKSALIFAVWTGNVEVVKHLLDVGANANGCDSFIRSPLLHAVHVGIPEIVQVLISHDADVNHFDHRTNESVLLHAITPANDTIVTYLLEAGANVNLPHAFHKAAMINRVHMLDILMKVGKVDINVTENRSKKTALMYAAEGGGEESIRFLINSGADLDLEDADGDTALEIAAKKGDLKCLRIWMEAENSNDSEFFSNHGDKLLHAAAKSDNIEILEFCLKDCKNIDAFNCDDETPLMCAAKAGILGNVKLLLENGADVNCLSKEGNAALIFSLEEENFECFEYLLESGADVDIIPEGKDTPLVLASRFNDDIFLNFLLKKSTRLINKVSERSEKTPLIAAISERQVKNVELLLDNGADINRPDGTGCTPLMQAARSRMIDLFGTLLEAGADVNAVDDGEISVTVMWDALASPECLELLLKEGSVLGSDGKITAVHTEYGLPRGMRWDMRSLKILFEYDVFAWEWYVYGEQGGQLNKIAFAAVQSGHSPYLFPLKEGQGQSSLLQEALMNNDYGTGRYLLANLYFTVEDVKTVTTGQKFQHKLQNCEDVKPQTLALLDSMTSQPWRLETLCFISISSLLRTSHQKVQRRSELVESLNLPEIFKSRLKFEAPVRKLCATQWKNLPDGFKDLTTLSKVHLPQEHNLTPCEDKCVCQGFGFKI